ncbi:MAG: hypothetical protein Q4A16_05065 [Lautropia sp.]|nr:hypothetical protein [Lautropia sp.]
MPWPQLRERLRARLGDDALYQIEAVADHRPERAWRRCLSEDAPVSKGAIDASTGIRPPPFPPGSDDGATKQMRQRAQTPHRTRSLSPGACDESFKHSERSVSTFEKAPMSVSVPVSSSSPVQPDHHITTMPGKRPGWLLPEPVPLPVAVGRIISGPERLESGWWDGGDTRRDYYVLETIDGQLAWAYVPAGQPDRWMLHGWFG